MLRSSATSENIDFVPPVDPVRLRSAAHPRWEISMCPKARKLSSFAFSAYYRKRLCLYALALALFERLAAAGDPFRSRLLVLVLSSTLAVDRFRRCDNPAYDGPRCRCRAAENYSTCEPWGIDHPYHTCHHQDDGKPNRWIFHLVVQATEESSQLYPPCRLEAVMFSVLHLCQS